MSLPAWSPIGHNIYGATIAGKFCTVENLRPLDSNAHDWKAVVWVKRIPWSSTYYTQQEARAAAARIARAITRGKL